MNAERLLEVLDDLIASNARYNLQNLLQQLVHDLSRVLQNPTHSSFQTQFAENLDRFRVTWIEMVNSFSPSQAKLAAEIGAAPFFLDEVPSLIKDLAGANRITPAVVLEEVERLRVQRETYISTITNLRVGLNKIGIQPHTLEPASAEIGFLLPRDLFHNELTGLVKELHTVDRIIRAFSEIAIGSAERVEVHQISTSDPIFFFGLDPATIALLANSLTWALATWRGVEEIRKIRAEMQKIKSFGAEEIEKIFDTKIQQEIATAVDQKVNELLPPKDGAGRHNEQRNDIKWALESILGRVERGMTIELRFLPPPKEEEEHTTEVAITSFEKLKTIEPQLQFPATVKGPILPLPPSKPPSEQPSN